MASYPTSVKSYTTKSDGAGNKIFAAHINDLQDEVTAIEDGLLNGTAPVNSSRITAPAMQIGGNSSITGELFVAKCPPTARVYATAVLPVANNVETLVQLDSERFVSTSVMHSTASNKERVICPSSGTYQAVGQVTWNGFSTTGIRFLRLYVNAVTVIGASRVRPDPTNGNVTEQQVSGIYQMQANDYFSLTVTQDSGSTGSLSTVTAYGQELGVVKIR